MRDFLRIAGECAPEIREIAIDVIDSLDLRWRRATQQHRKGARERLHVIAHVAEALPNDRRNATLAAEPREGRTERAHTASAEPAASSGIAAETVMRRVERKSDCASSAE